MSEDKYGTKDDPFEFMEGCLLMTIPKGVKKEDVRIKYLGSNKLLTYKEHVADWKKKQTRKAKAKLTTQLEAKTD